jgi:hypothetical protein
MLNEWFNSVYIEEDINSEYLCVLIKLWNMESRKKLLLWGFFWGDGFGRTGVWTLGFTLT